METVYKATRPDGTDFRTGTLNYVQALITGVALEIAKPDPASVGSCGHGIHVSPTARKTIQFSERSMRPWRWFEGTVEATDIIARDEQKLRVRAFKPTKELFLADIFGSDVAERITAVRESILTWKTIPWFKPPKKVNDDDVVKLIDEWREALTPWLRKGAKALSKKVKIVKSDADDDAADAADDAAAAADDAVAAADDAVAAADDAAADAAAAAADDAVIWRNWRNWRYRLWYMRPYYVLRRSVYWRIAKMPGASPWEPLVELYKLGCIPIGFVNGDFVVYVPEAI